MALTIFKYLNPKSILLNLTYNTTAIASTISRVAPSIPRVLPKTLPFGLNLFGNDWGYYTPTVENVPSLILSQINPPDMSDEERALLLRLLAAYSLASLVSPEFAELVKTTFPVAGREETVISTPVLNPSTMIRTTYPAVTLSDVMGFNPVGDAWNRNRTNNGITLSFPIANDFLNIGVMNATLEDWLKNKIDKDLAAGKSKKEVASSLGISEKDIQDYLNNKSLNPSQGGSSGALTGNNVSNPPADGLVAQGSSGQNSPNLNDKNKPWKSRFWWKDGRPTWQGLAMGETLGMFGADLVRNATGYRKTPLLMTLYTPYGALPALIYHGVDNRIKGPEESNDSSNNTSNNSSDDFVPLDLGTPSDNSTIRVVPLKRDTIINKNDSNTNK